MRLMQGFTLLELVTIILLLGIVATFVTGRTGSDFKAVRDAEELLQAIRYTQERAMQHTGDGQNYQISINATGYTLLPVAAALYADSLDGLLEGSSISPTGVIDFDGRGRPVCSAGLSCTSTTENIVISASGDSVTVTLQPYTGYVSR